MPPDQFSQNNSGAYDNQYTPSGYEKSKLRKILIIIVCILVCIGAIALIVHFFLPKSQQSKYTESATAAAKKHTPNAKVTDVKVSGGFAMAIVSDPTADSQANAGNTTIFKVNKDGSMTQIADGSYFSPIDLLELGIPLATQAKLTGTDINQVKQNLADACGYNGGALGFSGFDGSFNPAGWQIDSATLDGLEQALGIKISDNNTKAEPGKNVICVNATQNNSDATTDTNTYISTFTLEVQFITSDGTLTTHTLTFAIGPRYYRNYTLDGQKI